MLPYVNKIIGNSHINSPHNPNQVFVLGIIEFLNIEQDVDDDNNDVEDINFEFSCMMIFRPDKLDQGMA